MPKDAALMLEIEQAIVRGDVLDRFVESLSGDARRFVEETRQLRTEFLQHAEAMLKETSVHAAVAHGTWVAQHARDVAYRWASLMRAVERWAQYDMDAISSKLRRT